MNKMHMKMPPFVVKLFLFSCPIFISLLYIHSIIYLFIVCLLTYKSLCFCEAHNIIWIIILLLPWLIACFRSDEWVLQVSQSHGCGALCDQWADDTHDR